VRREEYAGLLQQIGHFKGAVIHQVNDRWRGECECGYVSTTRNTAKDAVGAIEHHRKKALEEWRRNGRVLPAAAALRK
jgi:hypothetical protein